MNEVSSCHRGWSLLFLFSFSLFFGNRVFFRSALYVRRVWYGIYILFTFCLPINSSVLSASNDEGVVVYAIRYVKLTQIYIPCCCMVNCRPQFFLLSLQSVVELASFTLFVWVAFGAYVMLHVSFFSPPKLTTHNTYESTQQTVNILRLIHLAFNFLEWHTATRVLLYVSLILLPFRLIFIAYNTRM